MVREPVRDEPEGVDGKGRAKLVPRCPCLESFSWGLLELEDGKCVESPSKGQEGEVLRGDQR